MFVRVGGWECVIVILLVLLLFIGMAISVRMRRE
jgi:uncharacterized membrane protein YqaE (UPF0057 family)